MLKLFVDRIISDSTVPIRWCVDRDFLAGFKMRFGEQDIADLYLFIVMVGPDGGEKERYLTPLGQLMQFVSFSDPGKNTILAVVLHGPYRDLVERLINRRSRYYMSEVTVTSGPGSNNSDYAIAGYCIGRFWPSEEVETRLEVLVPEAVFGQRPLDWTWVNWLYESAPVDQCQFRKRRLFAYTLQLPVLLIGYGAIFLFRLVVLACHLFCGYRGLRWSPLVHLRSQPFSETYKDLDNSVFIYAKSDEPRNFFLFPLLLLVVPWSWVTAFTLATVIGIDPRGRPLLHFAGWWVKATEPFWLYALSTMLVLILWAISMAVLLDIAALIGLLIIYAASPAERLLDRIDGKLYQVFHRDKLLPAVELEENLVCDGQPSLQLRALPRERQTVILRYQKLKAKLSGVMLAKRSHGIPQWYPVFVFAILT